MRCLASLLAVAMLWSFAPALGMTQPRSDEMSIGAADTDGAPAEPSPGEIGKLSAAALLDVDTRIAALRSQGFVPAPTAALGPGELHARLLERPPITSRFLR